MVKQNLQIDKIFLQKWTLHKAFLFLSHNKKKIVEPKILKMDIDFANEDNQNNLSEHSENEQESSSNAPIGFQQDKKKQGNKQKKASGGAEGGKFEGHLVNENKQLRIKVEELEHELIKEKKRKDSLHAERRSSIALAEKWKAEAEKMRQQLLQKRDYSIENVSEEENDNDNGNHSNDSGNEDNVIPEHSKIDTSSIDKQQKNSRSNNIQNVSSNASTLIKHVKKQSLSAILLLQQEADDLRILLGDEAGQVPNTKVPNIFDDIDLTDEVVPILDMQNPPEDASASESAENIVMNDMSTIDYTTNQVESEINKWKTEAEKWKGLLDNSETQHLQEMEKLTAKLRHEFHGIFDRHLQMEANKKLAPIQQEISDVKSRFNAITLQIQRLKEDKIKTIQQLNIALETSRCILIFFLFDTTYIYMYICIYACAHILCLLLYEFNEQSLYQIFGAKNLELMSSIGRKETKGKTACEGMCKRLIFFQVTTEAIFLNFLNFFFPNSQKKKKRYDELVHMGSKKKKKLFQKKKG
ncbi:hypothetical protein RFI_07073 [Reticulomyxa filosa]|uniref:Viral A-type inclusion protein n=1 Tax=Reticulomyxa filosa TaxID=46433 RepID=X6NW39_RETFI|nr:hypothetical protein RFI_07073 [Reticulomyxa filosa]|eukprot:ETO30044.1 hypothetical protein RFI_07073 [Reticulomyxa filosa]